MAKKNRIPESVRLWIEARKRFHLSHAHIQMARELGLNPKKLGKLANDDQEPWKAPLPAFLEHLYFKSFGKQRPERVLSIEELARAQDARKAQRTARRKRRKAAAAAGEPDPVPLHRYAVPAAPERSRPEARP
ncbi:MAG: hypothetical protein JXQ29_00315 [Planctomycetes bacterium]|nr:hypothetical protein [Planctomycetota bacterium]